ncbi:DUF4405 domain-containing protein [Maribellus comscasis]|uniref:DUF4405 domain-containing protein n=1 Tax=Maribellus comscasis TaxID=2681766 RepID=A0A6I6K389_9BACT|nr:DUF4405 domain-containing protein [Maribellus comscasis]QGY44394.1 DUF4405 domain-containing protein [Maribellus comscasis]
MKNKFSWRAFISFGLSYSFIVIIVSGIILYVAPPGRYAHWVNWEIAGLTKEGWQALHTVFSFSFVILSVFHLFTVNWKAFLSYIKSKTTSGLNKKREFIFSSGLFVIFFFGILFSLPPFQSVMDASEYFTDSWEKAEEEPPIPHAELLTLAELNGQLTNITLEEITNNLSRHQISFSNTNQQTLSEIAKINGTTPLEIYRQITRKPESQRQGSGIGRKTIEDFALELNKDADDVLKLLKENRIKAEKGQTLRDIGDNNNIPPRDIYDLISKE